MTKVKRRLVGIISVFSVVIVAAALGGLSFRLGAGTAVDEYQRLAVYAPHGVVATSQPLASQAGLDVLQRGGNAIDAAVTAAAVLSVVEPYTAGIGGDMFAILWSEADAELVGINGSGPAGSLMTLEALRARGDVPETGAESITVPGALSGWATLLDRYGTLSLAEVLEPAIALAEEGFPISDSISSEWSTFTTFPSDDPGFQETFQFDGKRAPEAGEWFANPDYARTLRLIAKEGPHVLYGGELGNRIAAHVEELGGYLTAGDFADYQASWVEPVSVPYKEFRVWELPPNGQGIAALEMLRILELYDLESMGHNSANYLHHLIEAKKLAYADLEAFVGDPNYMEATPDQLLDDSFIATRGSMINSGRAATRAHPGTLPQSGDTTYISVADNQGNMISLINSLAGGFGAKTVVPGTGFALQNRAVGFTLLEGRANTAGPGRLPFHTIIPGFVTRSGDDGQQEPWLSFGIVGGDQQPQAHVQFLLNVLLFDMNVQEALDAPRFRHWEANRVSFESSIDSSVVEQLKAMGHEPQNPFMETAFIVVYGPNRGLIFGGGQAIVKNDRGYVAGSDSRRDGLAAAH